MNTAVCLARLGIEVDYVTALGNDENSSFMIDAWRKEGIGVDLVMQKRDALPGLYMIKTDDQGERSFLYWRENSPARTLIEDWPEILEKLSSYHYLYLSGTTLAIYSAEARKILWEFFDSYRSNGGKIIFDSNYRPAHWPNPDEAKFAFDTTARNCDIALPSFADEQQLHNFSTKEACFARYRDFGVNEMVIKDGADKCLAAVDNKQVLLSTADIVKAVDTTGAGDAFNAGYLAARMNGKPVEDAVKQAQKCAALTVQYRGAIVPRNAFFERYQA